MRVTQRARTARERVNTDNSQIRMKRRQFIRLIGGAAAAWPLAARSQQSLSKIPVVGVLWHAGSAEEEDIYLSVLVKAFHDLGYEEGKNIHFDHRFPAENPERFRILAQELVDLKPDVIIAVTNLGLMEIKRASSTIPIVFVLGHDPVRDGFVESLAHPGGNATGLSPMGVDLSGKRLELLREAVPGPFACRASGRSDRSVQAAHDQVQ
jgi:putative ABC transport system substrate-binding protein